MKSKLVSALLLSGILALSSCEAIDLINSVGTVLTPPSSDTENNTRNENSSAAENSNSNTSNTSANTAPAAEKNTIEVLTSNDPTPVSTDWNLARQPNVQLQVSSFRDATFAKERLLDGQLSTSWFAADNDTPAQGKLPTVEIRFPQPVGVLSINLRGDREQQKGMMVEELSVLATSAQGVLLNETVALTPGQQDLNLALKKPLDGVTALRLTLTRSKGTPGLSEIEVLGR